MARNTKRKGKMLPLSSELVEDSAGDATNTHGNFAEAFRSNRGAALNDDDEPSSVLRGVRHQLDHIMVANATRLTAQHTTDREKVRNCCCSMIDAACAHAPLAAQPDGRTARARAASRRRVRTTRSTGRQ